MSKIISDHIYFLKNDSIRDHFNRICDECFELVYRTELYSFDINSETPNDEIIESLNKNFIHLFFNISGKKNIKKFVKFFGSEDAIIENLVRYFKVNIQNQILDKIMQRNQQGINHGG